MIRVCAWCKKDLGIEHDTKKIITHGICDSCAANFIQDLGMPLYIFLDKLKVPIFLVDKDGLMLTANKDARTLLGKDINEIKGMRGGEVIECAYAHLEGGCGRTHHCKSCTIRNLVMATHETGNSFHRVLAYPDINTGDGVRKMRFEISTELVAGVVFLRIDDMRPATTKVENTETAANSR